MSSANSTSTSNNNLPESVEEAAALLGATITRCGREHVPSVTPPKGMPSALASVQPHVPSSDLLMRLYDLRSMLLLTVTTDNAAASNNAPPPPPPATPLVAAPSILAVLMKLLPVSTSIATRPRTPVTAATASSTPTPSTTRGCSLDTPPMLSIPIRKLWVDCVALCHLRGQGLTGPAKMDTLQFVRQMSATALTNPKSARAAGGVRLAALDTITELLTKLPELLSPWSIEIMQLVLKALKSAGHGDPAYRRAAMRSACAAAIACRESHLERLRRSRNYSRGSGDESSSLDNSQTVLLKGAMDDKTLVEAIRVCKQAVLDRCDEVRGLAAHLAAVLGPMLIHASSSSDASGSSVWTSMEDVLSLALKNVDDESPYVSDLWSDAVARCLSTSIEHNYEVKNQAQQGRRRNDDAAAASADGTAVSPTSAGAGGSASTSGGTSSADDSGGAASTTAMGRFGALRSGRAALTPAQSCTGLGPALQLLVDLFVKAGGELSAPKNGGPYSTGGRAVRVGLALCLVKLVRLHSTVFGNVGMTSTSNSTDMGLSYDQVMDRVLRMLGDDMEKQLRAPVATDVTAATGGGGAGVAAQNLFGGGTGRFRSKGDPSLVRAACGRVLREGLSENVAEPAQLAILHHIIDRIQSVHPKNDSAAPKSPPLNANQLQVLLVELSCLVSALGEAAMATMEDATGAVISCLAHKDHGVRHEAALACVALSAVAPTSSGRQLLRRCLDEIQFHHAELVTVAMTPSKPAAGGDGPSTGLRMFRRAAAPDPSSSAGSGSGGGDPSMPSQFAIHGWSLTASLLLKHLPRTPGGLPSDLLNMALSVAEILVSFQFNEELAGANPGAVCLCVRSGFALMSGALATGPNPAVASNIAIVFGAWQKSCRSAKSAAAVAATSTASSSGEGGGKSSPLAPRHHLFCLDGVLTSVVAFLKYCSELLLTVPEALSHVTVLLEDSLQLFAPAGFFASIAATPPVSARIESAKASLLEAFAWLPSGTFPMAADQVFDMAASCIREAIEGEVTCSLLSALVSREDAVLDARTPFSARREGHVAGARELEETMALLTSDAVVAGEREAVIHMLPWREPKSVCDDGRLLLGSTILGSLVSDPPSLKPPSPLHEVGSWRKPVDPSSSAQVRLVDAAIQAFAATFGMKSGKEQHMAMTMLESLVPPLLAQLARSLGVNTSLAEQDRKPKAKEDNAAMANITAIILSCLKSIPQYESTHNVPISLGPQWMNMAKDLLLTLLPSASTLVRRAAAEGLALLATLGVSEDAHFMQSTVLHSLDELMQGNKPDGKPRTVALEPISASRSGALLTLASIQRTARRTSDMQLTKARERARSYGDDEVVATKEEELPILQMITRLLPSLAFHGLFRDYFSVRTHAMHSLALLLSYSNRLDPLDPDEVDMQLLRKTIELVEGNFGAAWTSASTDFDRGQESEVMSSEVSLLCTLLRVMTLLVSHLRHMLVEHPDVGRRFSVMASVALEHHSSHPAVYVEAMAFFETLASHHQVMPHLSSFVNASENPLCRCLTFATQVLIRPDRFATGCEGEASSSLSSPLSLRAAAQTLKAVSQGRLHTTYVSDMRVVPALLLYLEAAVASRVCPGAPALRNVAASEEVELLFVQGVALEKDIYDGVPTMIFLERDFLRYYDDMLLRWLLLSRVIMAGATLSEVESDSTQAYTRAGVVRSTSLRAVQDTELFLKMCGTPRWQVKTLAAQLATAALGGLSRHSGLIDTSSDPNLDYRKAAAELTRLCREAQQSKRPPPYSKVAFHLDELVSCACMSSVATLDHSELRALQGSSLLFLDQLIVAFGPVQDPEQEGKSILDQYSTQLFSSIKHALSAPDESACLEALQLFSVGCEALMTVLSVQLTADSTTLKRLLRPAMPSTANMSYFRPSDPVPIAEHVESDSSVVDIRSDIMFHVSKVATAAAAFTQFESSPIGPIITSIRDDVLPDQLGLAAHAAAIAIDGASLLLGHRFSLSGKKVVGKAGRRIQSPKSGYLYSNLDDVSDPVKAQLVRAWSACACYCVRPLIGASTSDKEANRESSFDEWVVQVVPLLLSGIVDADEAQQETDVDSQSHGQPWAESILDPASIEIDCLRGVTTLMESNAALLLGRWKDETGAILDRLRESVMLPALIGSDDESPLTLTLVREACSFVKATSTACAASVETGSDSWLLLTLLEPLNKLQQGVIDATKAPATSALVLSTCLEATAILVGKRTASDALVLAMVNLVLDVLQGKHGQLPESVNEAAHVLLSRCLRHKSLEKKTNGVARRLAADANWAAWSSVLLASPSEPSEDGSIARGSSDPIRQCLIDDDPARVVDALSAVVAVVPKARPDVTAALLSSLGGDVMDVLLKFGTSTAPMSARRSVCADSIKFLLLGYQQLVVKSGGEGSDSKSPDEDEVVQYLALLFEALLVLLRFNGLPSHPPPPGSGGDEFLGRMAAQAIVTTARTTPVAFKTCVSTLMADNDRALLELAVRAEMTGYAAAPAAVPGAISTKKALNVASFKR